MPKANELKQGTAIEINGEPYVVVITSYSIHYTKLYDIMMKIFVSQKMHNTDIGSFVAQVIAIEPEGGAVQVFNTAVV